MARSTSSLAHKANNNNENKNIPITRQGYIIHRPSKIMQFRARLPTLLQLPLQLPLQPSDLPRGPDAQAAPASEACRSPPVTPALREERGGAVQLVGTSSRFEGKIVDGVTGWFGCRIGCVGVGVVGASVIGSAVRRVR
jgi:hypothetical protein